MNVIDNTAITRRLTNGIGHRGQHEKPEVAILFGKSWIRDNRRRNTIRRVTANVEVTQDETLSRLTLFCIHSAHRCNKLSNNSFPYNVQIEVDKTQCIRACRAQCHYVHAKKQCYRRILQLCD